MCCSGHLTTQDLHLDVDGLSLWDRLSAGLQGDFLFSCFRPSLTFKLGLWWPDAHTWPCQHHDPSAAESGCADRWSVTQLPSVSLVRIIWNSAGIVVRICKMFVCASFRPSRWLEYRTFYGFSHCYWLDFCMYYCYRLANWSDVCLYLTYLHAYNRKVFVPLHWCSCSCSYTAWRQWR